MALSGKKQAVIAGGAHGPLCYLKKGLHMLFYIMFSICVISAVLSLISCIIALTQYANVANSHYLGYKSLEKEEENSAVKWTIVAVISFIISLVTLGFV